MRRENKLALIVGFSVLLVVAVLVSDHLSQARQDEVGDGLWTLSDLPDESLLINAPLAADSRVRPEVPVLAETRSRVDEAAVMETQRPSAGSPVGPPLDQAVYESRPVPAGVAPPSSFVQVPAEREVRVSTQAPLVFGNGPAASGATGTEAGGPQEQSGGDAGGGSGGLFDWNSWQISKWLNDPKSAPSDREPEPAATAGRGGHVPDAGVYVVQPGDTLYEICERLYGDGNKWRDIARINEGRVREDGTVFVGVTLKLLPGARSAVAPVRSAARPAASEPARQPETRRYVVKKGDTLSQIAQREVGSVRHLDEIRKLNTSLHDGKDRIMVGQTLVLPVARNGR